MGITLRPYQVELLNKIRAAYASGLKSVCAVAPTGAGKSLCFAEISKHAGAKGRSTCIIVHRDTLLRQAAEKLDAFGIPYGIIAAGYMGTTDTIQIASAQSLVRRLDRYKFDFIIFDEAHLSSANTWKSFTKEWPEAHVLGFTATPVFPSGRGLDSVFQSLALGPTIGELVADGYLCSPVTYGPVKKVDLSSVRTQAGDYDLADLERVIDTPKITGDAIAEVQKICPGVPTMIFCVSIHHSKDVAATFNAAGLRAASVDSTMPREEIRDKIAALSDGRIQYLASCDLLGVGFDAPSVGCAISLRPTMSLILYIQQAGRALRPLYAPGFDMSTRAGRLAAIAASSKPFAILADHVGNFIRHGLVDDDREWTLEGRKKRAGTGKSTVPIKQCRRCFAVFRPAPKCPKCGHVDEVDTAIPDVTEGTLAPIDKVALRRARWREERACVTMAELVALGKKRKYASPRGWAFHRWQARKHQTAQGESFCG